MCRFFLFLVALLLIAKNGGTEVNDKDDLEDVLVIQLDAFTKSLQDIKSTLNRLSQENVRFSLNDFAIALSAISADVQTVLEESRAGACKEQLNQLTEKSDDVQKEILTQLTTTEGKIYKWIQELKEDFAKSLQAKQSSARDPSRCNNKSGEKLQLRSLSIGTYLYHVNKIDLNWLDANEFCKARGLDLVSLQSQDELSDVWSFVNQTDIEYWTSGSDRGKRPGNFHWSTGELVDPGLRDPSDNNDFKQGSQTCISLSNGKYTDVPCFWKTKGIICEMPAYCQ